MSAKRKILFISTLALGLLTLMVVVLVTLSFRDYGIASAKEKSKLTAELVRDALTAHMINGVMDKREYFLDKITRSENVKKMWLVRAPSVEAQFGPSLYGESMRDAIDRKVLEEGKASEILKESAKEVTLRVTIPYIADSKGLPNCLSCHEAKEGEVLGAISMIFDIDSFRSTGLSTTLKILAAATALLLLTVYLVGRLITPYTELFEAFRKSLHHAEEGDFTHKVSTPLKDEMGELAKWLNSLTEKLHQVVSDIDRRISILIAYNKNQYNSNPLIRTKEIIGELADVYKFRRNIELLDKKEEVYDNITAIFLYKLNLKRFTIIQVQNGIEELIYPRNEEEAGSTLLQFSAQYVHAIPLYRDSANNVFSGYMPKENEYYINASFAISPSVLWQLSFAFDQYKEYERAKNLVSVIYNYLDAAKAILHTRMLMEMLKESSLRDPLTGLYNRKFLEEYIESATHQALRSKTTYAILMIDVDFFKMVNDTYGHDVGDQVISGLSNIIQNTIREADLAVRFGGEEFIVLLYNSAPEGAERVAQKIRSRFSEMVFEVNHERFSKTLSVGISMFPEDGPTVWRVIKFADIALYKAKESGRNQVVRFHSSMLPDGFNY
ncbi:GGDEF domain-containing protein [Wolinella succinogenes]|uniref:GGDEF domain-containing protein n=1 Tax=Wolinella succinogenes TaxID=844 RepID=UPI002409A61E|nr:diguanylate cyclase [Wolinella succinogenes]